MTHHVPEGKQSILPPRRLLMVLLAVLVLFGLIWTVVTIAVAHDDQGCPSTGKAATEARCR